MSRDLLLNGKRYWVQIFRNGRQRLWCVQCQSYLSDLKGTEARLVLKIEFKNVIVFPVFNCLSLFLIYLLKNMLSKRVMPKIKIYLKEFSFDIKKRGIPLLIIRLIPEYNTNILTCTSRRNHNSLTHLNIADWYFFPYRSNKSTRDGII